MAGHADNTRPMSAVTSLVAVQLAACGEAKDCAADLTEFVTVNPNASMVWSMWLFIYARSPTSVQTCCAAPLQRRTLQVVWVNCQCAVAGGLPSGRLDAKTVAQERTTSKR